jgi:hypothetical protein
MTTDVFRLSASDYPFGIFKLFSDKDNEIMSTSILLTIHIDFSYSWLWHLHHLDIDMYCHIHYFREKKAFGHHSDHIGIALSKTSFGHHYSADIDVVSTSIHRYLVVIHIALAQTSFGHL